MTNEICVYYNKPLYDQKVILPLLEFYRSNYIPFLSSENQRRTCGCVVPTIPFSAIAHSNFVAEQIFSNSVRVIIRVVEKFHSPGQQN